MLYVKVPYSQLKQLINDSRKLGLEAKLDYILCKRCIIDELAKLGVPYTKKSDFIEDEMGLGDKFTYDDLMDIDYETLLSMLESHKV